MRAANMLHAQASEGAFGVGPPSASVAPQALWAASERGGCEAGTWRGT
jgi:hypothetical protein